MLRLFYRQVEVVGLENLPQTGPVITVANHNNSLIDGAIVSGFLPRIPRLVAASSVWKIRPLVPLMRLAAVIPIYREHETAGAAQRNLRTFATATDLLAAGGVLAVFPEGKSHDDPDVKPLKSGTARMALRAQAETPAPGIVILPIGLSFDAKGRFRSRALMELGKPIAISDVTQGLSGPAAVRALTSAIRAGMLEVAQNYDNRLTARLIGRSAELWEVPDPKLHDFPPMADTTERRLDFTRLYAWLRQAHPGDTQTAWNVVQTYDRSLRRFGLRDAHIGAHPKPGDWRRLLVRSLAGLLIRLPVAMIGMAMNLLPFLAVQLIAFRGEPDKRATLQVFPGIILTPLCWGALAFVVSVSWGWGAGALTFLAAPAATPVTLDFLDRATRLYHDARAWKRLKDNPDLTQTLSDQRRDVQEQLAILATLVEEMPGTD